ncbi:MAG: hypothetical protein KAR51_01230 [Candidatus Aenigmarchaeota archaeon]|nr:hypothetical protein [Candidatus Aenigmarchaeota archaeon]
MNQTQIQELVLDYIETYPAPISGWLGIKNKTSYPLFGFYSIMPTIEWLGTDISDSVETINYDYLVNLKYSDNVPIIDIIGLNSKENLIKNAKHN